MKHLKSVIILRGEENQIIERDHFFVFFKIDLPKDRVIRALGL